MSLLRHMLFFFAVVFGWATAALASQAPPSANPPSKPDVSKETCAISGMLIAKNDGTPLKGAIIQLSSKEDHDHVIAARTGADGHFALKNIPAGSYRLNVSVNDADHKPLELKSISAKDD